MTLEDNISVAPISASMQKLLGTSKNVVDYYKKWIEESKRAAAYLPWNYLCFQPNAV